MPKLIHHTISNAMSILQLGQSTDIVKYSPEILIFIIETCRRSKWIPPPKWLNRVTTSWLHIVAPIKWMKKTCSNKEKTHRWKNAFWLLSLFLQLNTWSKISTCHTLSASKIYIGNLNKRGKKNHCCFFFASNCTSELSALHVKL